MTNGNAVVQDAVYRILPMCHRDDPSLGDVERQPGRDQGQYQPEQPLTKNRGRFPAAYRQGEEVSGDPEERRHAEEMNRLQQPVERHAVFRVVHYPLALAGVGARRVQRHAKQHENAPGCVERIVPPTRRLLGERT